MLPTQRSKNWAVYESRIVNIERKLSILQWQVTYPMVMMTGIALRLLFS